MKAKITGYSLTANSPYIEAIVLYRVEKKEFEMLEKKGKLIDKMQKKAIEAMVRKLLHKEEKVY